MELNELQHTVEALVSRTVKVLQEEGLLLTPEQIQEYHSLKEKASDRMLSGREVATILGVTPGMVTQLRMFHGLPAKRIGRCFKYSLIEVEKYKKKKYV